MNRYIDVGNEVALNERLADHEQVVVKGVGDAIPPLALPTGEFTIHVRCTCCLIISA